MAPRVKSDYSSTGLERYRAAVSEISTYSSAKKTSSYFNRDMAVVIFTPPLC